MKAAIIVFVPGIWMPASEMLILERHLSHDYGYRGKLFSYPSVSGTIDENARRLADFVVDTGHNKVHIVGHSLGGVVAVRMLATIDGTPTGRVVCLGSPLNGSRAGKNLKKHHWGAAILGHSITAGVIDNAAANWAGRATEQYDIGVIAGTRSTGLGRLFATFAGENDGTVAVSETRLAGLKDHICVAASHTGLVVSKDVVIQTAAFLERGEFLRDN